MEPKTPSAGISDEETVAQIFEDEVSRYCRMMASATLDAKAWDLPPIFRLLKDVGKIEDAD